MLFDDVVITFDQHLVETACMPVRISGQHLCESGVTRRNSDCVCIVGASMENAAAFQYLHDFASSTKRGQGKSSTDRFGQTNHIGLHFEIFGGTAISQLHSGFDFIKNEERSVLIAQFA